MIMADSSASTQLSSAPLQLFPEILSKSPETQSLEDLFRTISNQSGPKSVSINTSSIVSVLAVTPDEKHLIGGFKTGSICVWNQEKNYELAGNWIDNTACINTLLCTKDYTIYAGNDAGEILFWNFKENQKKTFRNSKFGITGLIVTSNQNIILTTKSGGIEIWNENHAYVCGEEAHEDEINCLKISKDEQKIYTCSNDQTIMVWKFDDKIYEISRLCAHESAVILLEIFGNTLISGDWNGVLVQWNEDLEVIDKKYLPDPFRCFVKTNDDRYLFTANESTEKIKISVWNIAYLSEGKPFYIKQAHAASINSMCYMPKSNKLASCSEEKIIKIWDFSQTSKESSLINKSNIECFSLNKTALIYSRDSTIKICSLPDCKKKKSLSSKPGIRNLILDSERLLIAHDSSENIVYVWRLKLYSEPYCKFLHSSPINSMIFSGPDIIVTGCEDGTIKILNLIFQNIEYQINEDQPITDIKSDSKYIYIANKDGVISIWKVEKEGEKKKEYSLKAKLEYKSEVFCIGISEENVLVAGGDACVLKMWRWKDMKFKMKPEELVGHTKTIYKLIVNKGLIFSASRDGSVKIWSIDLKLLYYSIEIGYEITNICINETADSIYFLSKKGINYIQNPLKSNELLVYPQKYSWFYLQYLKKLFQNKIKFFDEFWKDYIIFPYIVNLLYIFIKANHPDLLKKAMASGVKFLQEKSGQSPLSVALSWKNNICADVILKALSKMKLAKEYGILESLENCINKIINSNLYQLPKIFDSLFPITTSRLTSYGQLKRKTPMIIESKSKRIDEENFINMAGLKKEQVEFRTSICKLDFIPGSYASIQLLRAISHCKNPDLFRTPFLKSILKYKWNKVYYILLGEAIVYGVMMLIMSIMTISSYNAGLSAILFLLNTVMVVREGVQIFESYKKYYKDFQNYLDMTRIISTYILNFLLVWDYFNIIKPNPYYSILGPSSNLFPNIG
jgi:WD40 repeat protein